MAQSKAAKKRKKAGIVNTGCFALSYEANKAAVRNDERKAVKKRERKAGKKIARHGDGGW